MLGWEVASVGVEQADEVIERLVRSARKHRRDATGLLRGDENESDSGQERDRLYVDRGLLGRFAIAAQCSEHRLAGHRRDRPDAFARLSREPVRLVQIGEDLVPVAEPDLTPSARP